MDIVMPPAFPEKEFRAFGLAASKFFPALLSDEALFDPLEKKRQFDWSWQAVRYRYRSCAECQDEFGVFCISPQKPSIQKKHFELCACVGLAIEPAE